LDKSELTQRICYERFKEFVNLNPRERIFFISTCSQTENPYNYYKQMAEAHLLSIRQDSYVIRLPTLIGKGICERMRDDPDNVKIFGEMELMTAENAAEEVLRIVEARPLVRNIRLNGTNVSAKLAKDLIGFGKGNF